MKEKHQNLDLWEDGHNRGSDAEEHIDADEDLVLSAAIRVSVVDIEHDQGHQRQQVAHCGDRQQSCEETTRRHQHQTSKSSKTH